MSLRTRRIAATAAAALAVFFAAAAASSAQARFVTTASETGIPGLTQIVHDPYSPNYTNGCKVKPKWGQKSNAEQDRIVSQKIWVKRCGSAASY